MICKGNADEISLEWDKKKSFVKVSGRFYLIFSLS